jgi:hypothetical protein
MDSYHPAVNFFRERGKFVKGPKARLHMADRHPTIIGR